MVEMLKDQNEVLRTEVARSLGHLGKSDDIVIEALIELLRDQDSSVRSTAAESLGRLGNRGTNVIEALLNYSRMKTGTFAFARRRR